MQNKYTQTSKCARYMRVCMIALGVLIPCISYAAQITFESNPLFSGNGIMPGDTVQKQVTVTNTATGSIDVALRVQELMRGGLEDYMLLSVYADGTPYVSTTTFSALYAQQSLALGSIPAGVSRVYIFSATLPDEAGDIYQGKNMKFDIQVGTSDGSAQGGTDTPIVVSRTGGTSGGGRGGFLKSTTTNEAAEEGRDYTPQDIVQRFGDVARAALAGAGGAVQDMLGAHEESATSSEGQSTSSSQTAAGTDGSADEDGDNGLAASVLGAGFADALMKWMMGIGALGGVSWLALKAFRGGLFR